MTAAFSSLADFTNLLMHAPVVDTAALTAARNRNAQLTKPPGALGRLEELAIWYAGWRGTPQPSLEAPQVVIFAGNHGITAQGVSAFPAEVTEQMVMNFKAGGAAINQLSSCFGARLDVHALQLEKPTADFTQGPALSEEEYLQALLTGWSAVDPSSDLVVTGEMGIGNTTAAAAIALALYGGTGADWAGRGTGIDDAALDRKAQVIEAGLKANPEAEGSGLEALRCLGGREIAAMAGAIAHARILKIPVILDGFICSVAAAAMDLDVPGILDHAVAGHLSAEGAHHAVLTRLGKKPLLSMDMRLGEGSGAALAISMLKAAVACHSGMATFAEAGVADG